MPRLDDGFCDGIGHICSGKLQEDITDLARGWDSSLWSEYDNGHQLCQSRA